MKIEETIYSPCSGIVDRILTEESNQVYEWEKLFLIKSSNGTLEEVSIGISGFITSVNVKEGYEVGPQTVLAILQDDLLPTGSD